MSTSQPQPQPFFKFSPFHAILQDGLERVLDVVKSDNFSFIVKGRVFISTIAEATLFSPKVHEMLRSDPSVRSFDISAEDDNIDVSLFSLFLEIARNYDCPSIEENKKLCLLSLCRAIGNERLALVFLSWFCSTGSESESVIGSSSSGSATTTAKIVGFCNANIDSCASQFHSYSIDTLHSLDQRTLHSLLRSRSLHIKTEDDLWPSLVSLGSEYCEYLGCVEISLLTSDCVSIFVETLPFDELTFDARSKIVQRFTHVRDEGLYIHRYRQYQLRLNQSY
jgi:hypothetical protein